MFKVGEVGEVGEVGKVSGVGCRRGGDGMEGD